jgi:hypothetical protein
MKLTNPDPGFWHALAAAGSGQRLQEIAGHLTLTNMRAANPDPGFWQALAAAGSAARLQQIASD